MTETWRERAREAHRFYYESFRDAWWDEFDRGRKHELYAKICYAVFGLPIDEDFKGDNFFLAYNEKQRVESIKIGSKILEVSAKRLRVFTTFVFCRSGEDVFSVPVFRVFIDHKDVPYKCKFVDTSLRTYDSWKAWLEENRLPELEYCYPKFGYYTCDSSGDYVFNEKKDPILEFGSSPACTLLSQVGRTLDVVSCAASLVVGAAAIASMFTPLGPITATVVLGTGATTGVYGAGRSIDRLVDKGTHGESLTDLEAITSYAAIALTPLSFATSAANAALTNGAKTSGRIFSTTTRAAATALNCATFGLQGGFLFLGFANLVDKAKEDRMTSLDVLQFSMSLFFFANTLVQPKTAAGIIKQAQSEHIQQFQDKMGDPEAKANYRRFVNQNIEDKGMKPQSKIVRTINRMQDSETFFKGLSEQEVLQIGGRKGKTLLVGDGNRLTRVNPNRVTAAMDPSRSNALHAANLQRSLPTDVAIKNKEDMERILKWKHGEADLKTALDLSEKLNLKKLEHLGSILEIIGLLRRELEKAKKENELKKMEESGQLEKELKADIEKAESLSRKNGRRFENPVAAAHLLRLHGRDFATLIPEDTDFYLMEKAELLFGDGDVLLQESKKKSVTVKLYLTKNDEYGILVEEKQEAIFATTFSDMKFAKKFCESALDCFCEEETLLDIPGLVTEVAQCIGLPDWRPMFFTPFGICLLENLELLESSRCVSDIAKGLVALRCAYTR